MFATAARAQFSNIQYTTTSDGNGGLIITGFSASGSGALSIPSTITVNGVAHPVTGIGQSAFYGNTNLTSVTFPSSLTSIGLEAFGECYNLTSVTIPNGVVTIAQSAFETTGLTSLMIPNSVTSIGNGAFDSCVKLATVIIGNGVTSIQDYAFYTCTGLTSVTLGSSVTSIGKYVFQGCTSLGSVTLPSSVTSIGDGAFDDCTSLTSASIGSGVTSIGPGAFNSCTSLTSMTIPASVTSIGAGAFTVCTSLTSINVSAQNTAYSSMGGVLFNLDRTTLIQAPGSLAGSYTIPSSVISIGDSAFQNCGDLISVTIPGNVTSIGASAFNFCTGLTSLTIGSGVISIGQAAFGGETSLTSVTIPPSVTSIGLYGFSGCPNLASAVFLGNAPAMGGSVFGHQDANGYYVTTGFTAYYYNNATGFGSPTWTADASDIYSAVNVGNSPGPIPTNTSNAGPFNVTPDFNGGLVVTGYSGAGGAVVIPSTITINGVVYPVVSLGDSAFAGCTSMTSVTIPTSITTIGNQVFQNCTGLISVTIPNSVISIGSDAFASCTGLRSVAIGNGVTAIGSSMFQGCTSLSSVTIPNSVTSIEYSAFWGCTSMTSVTIPPSVNSMGGNAFYGCSSLISAVFLGNAPAGGGGEFDNTGGSFAIYYYNSGTGFTSPTWQGYPAVNLGNAGDGISLGGNMAFGLVTIDTTATSTLTIVNPGSTPITVSSISYPSGFSGNWSSGTIQAGAVQEVTVTFAPTSVGTYSGVITVDSNAHIGAKTIAVSGYGINASPYTIASDGNGGIIITGYTGPGGALVIPGTINGLTVTGFGNYAFSNHASLTSVTIPTSITRIGDYAFEYCGGLTSVSIPTSITSIAQFAFFDCYRLTSVTIPASLTSIEFNAFSGCTALTSLVFLGNAPTLGGNAFVDEASSFTIDYYLDATGFTSPTWAPDPSNSYPAVNLGVTSPAEFTTASDGDGGLTITSYLGSAGTVIIPAAINGETITGIGASAFANKTSLVSLTLPNGVISLGSDAFHGCTGLTNVTIPRGLTSLGSGAFENCSNLTAAQFLGIAPSMGGNVFHGAASGFTVSYYMGAPGFTSPIWTPDANDSYPAVALSPFITSSDGHGGLLIVNYVGFGGATVIPSTINGLTVTGIGASAFEDKTSLTSLTIPASVTSIGEEAFLDCSSLTSVTIPASVTILGQAAFFGCTGLTSAVFLGNAPTMGGYVFYQDANGFNVEYYSGAVGFASPTWNPDPYDSYPAIALTTFAQWATSEGIVNSPMATPKEDGVPNLLKYLFDINPAATMTATDRAAMPTVGMDTTTNPGTQYLTLTYRENPTAAGIAVAVQISPDLRTWTTVTPDLAQQLGSDPDTGDPIMEVGVNMHGTTRGFIRLNVSTKP